MPCHRILRRDGTFSLGRPRRDARAASPRRAERAIIPRRAYRCAALFYVSSLLLGLVTPPASAQSFNPVVFYQENCALCHTIGGGAALGPDLQDIHKQVDLQWFVRFVLGPEAMVNQRDARAVALLEQFGGVMMPAIEMSDSQAEALWLWLTWESTRIAIERGEQTNEPSGEETAATGSLSAVTPMGQVALSTRELTPQDAISGSDLFQGQQRLVNGAPACIGCHTINLLGGLGGGRLGPDLTGVYERMGGRRGLEAWLRTSPSPTMRMVFGSRPVTAEEALSLVAYFEQASGSSPPAFSSGISRFLLYSVAGMGLLLLVMGWIWRGRFRTARRALVEAARG